MDVLSKARIPSCKGVGDANDANDAILCITILLYTPSLFLLFVKEYIASFASPGVGICDSGLYRPIWGDANGLGCCVTLRHLRHPLVL